MISKLISIKNKKIISHRISNINFAEYTCFEKKQIFGQSILLIDQNEICDC